DVPSVTTQTPPPQQIPRVPPSETTVDHRTFQSAPIPPFGGNGMPMQPPQNPNEYCNVSDIVPTPEDTLLQRPLPRPEAKTNHNAYRDEPSATSETVRKKHFFLKGTTPLEGETPYAYHGRMLHERSLIHEENKIGLKSSATKLSLLLLLYIVLYQIFTNTVPIILEGFKLVDTENTLHKTLLLIGLYLLIYPITFSLVIYLGNLGETHKIKTFLHKPKCSPAYVLEWFIIATGCTYVINIAFTIITTAIGYDNGMTAEPFTSVLDGVSQLVILCVFAPIFEELLFRGVMLSHHLKYGAWHACIITSLYFGFFHMNLQQLFYTFVGGLFMAMVVLKTGSLITSMIIHALLNFTSFLQLLALSLIDNYDAYMNGVDMLPKGHPAALVLLAFTTLLPWIFMLAAVIMLIVELVTNKNTFKMPKGDSGLTAKEKAATYFSTPAVWVLIVVAILAIALTEFAIYLSNNTP
ncbi:MAG: CPBP family intramembrane metalloprotease, partial [Clostridia bacterium]|nr:CPBP family intramembrane metalloprotease [Clostridia bacterium]